MAKHPIAVLITDVHYTLQTLKLAEAAMHMAIKEANQLEVPLWVLGDIHDTKANMRGECVNAMLSIFEKIKCGARVWIGNHDKINEKSADHSLHFLEGVYAELISAPCQTTNGIHCIPYMSDINALRAYLATVPAHSTILMHQGLQGSNMGDYIIDHTALTPEDVAGHRVISGHYHERQTIALPNGGVWDFLGNPYTLSYGEAKHKTKGYHILYNDGSIEFKPTNLREHVILELAASLELPAELQLKDEDLVWVKVRGTHEELAAVTRKKVADTIKREVFKLDLYPTEAITEAKLHKPTSSAELMDTLIDSLTNTSEERKTRLKGLWKSMV